jgi:CHAD domain-containing protein
MMPLDVPTRTYLLAPGTSAGEVLGALTTLLSKDRRRRPPSLDAVAGSASVTTSTVLDTADRRLRAAGLELAMEAGASGPGRLVLREGATARSASAPAGRSRRRYLVTDLPDGWLKARLARLVDVRALLPLAVLRRRDQPVDVRNRDAKTVVRLTLVDLWALDKTDRIRLTGRVELSGVLGYPKPFARIDELLREGLGLDRATVSVVDDAVRALGGDPTGVSGRLQLDLVPNEPAGVAAVRVLRRLADMVEANLPGTRGDLDPEFLHDLRVAIRRSRSVLREMKAVFDPAGRQAQADALRWIQAVTGPTRDLDVQLLEWDDLVANLPAERRTDVGVAHGVLVARRAAAFRALKATLRSAEYRARWSTWRDFLDRDGSRPTGSAGRGPDADRTVRQVAGRRIRSVYRRMVREGKAIDDDSPAQALHDLRKRGKELRYLLELFGGLFPASQVKPLVASLKGLQDVLGRHQDREVQAENLRALAPELAALPGGADALLALGALVDRLQTEQHEARAHFVDRFGAFAGLPVPR